MSQKHSSPTKSLMVSRRISTVSDCKHADSLFSTTTTTTTTATTTATTTNNNSNNTHRIPSPPKSPLKEVSRRGSLSSLLGNASSGTYPETPQDILSRQQSSNLNLTSKEESESNLDDPLTKYRQELQAPRTPPAKFGELQRLDSRTYGDLETLLLSQIDSYSEYNYTEEGAASYDSSAPPSDALEMDDEFDAFINNNNNNTDSQSILNPFGFGLELSSKDSKFRINNKGEILIEDGGEYRRASKNLSLYYDMITDKELDKLYEEYSKNTLPSSSSPPSPSFYSSKQTGQPFQSSKHELTAVDMLTPNRAYSFISSINNEKKQKEALLEKNSEFIDTLCRITELKSQTGESNKLKKPKSDHLPHHPLHSLFGSFNE